MIRSCLKWAGGKAGIIDTLRQHLPAGKRLVEPFTGSATVFMNTDYDAYLLGDINPDLINMFNTIKRNPSRFISYAASLFRDENDPTSYYQLREDFNKSGNQFYRAVLFLYLNRHGYNGMCRYNQRGGFNVPYGKYKAPYFPAAEIRAFAEKADKALFLCLDFEECIEMANDGDVIYCDPPYVPVSKTADFTNYHTGGFNTSDQYRLMYALRKATRRGCHVVASNSDTAESLKIYGDFKITHIEAPRAVSCKAESRQPAREIIATMRASA
ncbi:MULTISPECIES: Dam family site-specific DNA-(adenine-N6)-methyltransferase [Serratia]|uniref:Dam family site-specific DNA-(adenine-N6)-methyltransferase n=1 Tax=Serratia TaxID=613 RepID=UPI000745295C|nr:MULTISPECIES: Dam family site-specific DNA-(adenine-N6)-methyltransferase [Serratia]NVM48007.1 Dam family site-specific DNA-(adenine-N6)-methyltransferase [Serratia ureilytica]CVD72046.1 DNA adenine methylase [Serratia marcescens]